MEYAAHKNESVFTAQMLSAATRLHSLIEAKTVKCREGEPRPFSWGVFCIESRDEGAAGILRAAQSHKERMVRRLGNMMKILILIVLVVVFIYFGMRHS
jgi:hypothetical protein